MTARDNLHKLGDFPAVRAALRWVDTPGNDSMVAKEAEEHILAAIEELSDKLVKSVEWGRIEQQRKEKAEEELKRVEEALKWAEDERIEYVRRYEAACEWAERAEEDARTAKMIAEEERRRADRLAKERDWQYDENVERIRLETAAEDRAEKLLWMLDRLAQQAADVGKAEGFYFPRTKEAVLAGLMADYGRDR